MALGTYINFFFLAIIQGVTEWLPISSSGVLVLFENLLSLKNKNLNLLFNISVHAGSLLAITIYFRKEIKNLFYNLPLIKNIVVATVPVVIIGFCLTIFNLNIFLQNIEVVAISTIVFSIFLYLSDKTQITKKFENSISNKNSLIIGIAQAIALIPGTSRSGITITAARYLGFSRVDAAKFSFLISMPTLLAATVLGAASIKLTVDIDFIITLIIGFTISFVVSITCIKFFLKFVEKNSLNVFVIARLILGVILLIYLAN